MESITMTVQNVLQQSALFTGLPTSFRLQIANLAAETTHAAGAVLFAEGDHADSLFLLVSGLVHIQVQLGNQQRVTSVIVKQPGKLVGWSGFVTPHTYTATAVCQEDTRLLAIKGEALAGLLADYPEIGFVVMQRMAELISSRLRNMQQFVLKTL
jgi:CRP-like cAMP-binding protein